jgi:hypothetical protein
MASGSLAAVTGSYVGAIRAALEASEGDRAWQPAPR